jgi:hypothetical protein
MHVMCLFVHVCIYLLYVCLYVPSMYEKYVRNLCMYDVFMYVCMYVIMYIYVYVFTYMYTYIHLQSSSEIKHQFEILFSLSWNRGCDSRAVHVECVVDKV